jgi:magnesium transporter
MLATPRRVLSVAVLVLTDLDEDKILAERRRDGYFWLDLSDPPPDELRRAGELLDLHPLAMEDTIEWNQRPKVDNYGSNVLVVFYTAKDDGGDVRQLEVHIYVSGSFVLTVRRDDCDALDSLHDKLADEPVEDEGYLVYRIFDTLTDAYYPVIDALEARIDVLEEQVLLHARREQIGEIYRLRQDVRELLRTASSQRDHFGAAADAVRSLPGLQQGTRETLRDVGDHLVQVAGELGRQNDDLGSLAATYFNANADRLNATATRLSIVGTLFVVATIVTGFFGMNFGWLVDHIKTLHSFLIFGVGGLVVPMGALGAYFWIKRRDLF